MTITIRTAIDLVLMAWLIYITVLGCEHLIRWIKFKITERKDKHDR